MHYFQKKLIRQSSCKTMFEQKRGTKNFCFQTFVEQKRSYEQSSFVNNACFCVLNLRYRKAKVYIL